MDNPQETEKLNKIKWLAGFFDAEGSVSFNYKPNIDIVNTCSRTIFNIKFILNSLGINIGINKREKPSKSSKKPRWDIFLRHEEQIKPFLKNVSPYIYGKRKQIETIQDWYNNDEKIDLSEKIKFINQLNNIVICPEKKEVVMKKLKTNDLYKYIDIQVLDDSDGIIYTYDNFYCNYYISGLIDGDGCFNMNFRSSKKNRNRYTPQVMLINTNKEIIKRFCSFLKYNNIGYHVSFRTAGKTTNRRRWDIIVSGVKRSEKLCSLLVNSLETKKEQCNLLLQYCRFRLLNEKSKNDEIGFECKKALESIRKGEK